MTEELSLMFVIGERLQLSANFVQMKFPSIFISRMVLVTYREGLVSSDLFNPVFTSFTAIQFSHDTMFGRNKHRRSVVYLFI